MKKSLLKFMLCFVFATLFLFQITPQVASAATTIDGYVYTVSGGNATITGYDGVGGNISIPSTINDGTNTYTVTAIGGNAFFDQSNLVELTLPDSINSIGIHAFYGCINLKKINLGQNVKSIGYAAFYYCNSLEGIILPNSLTEIQSGAFTHCVSLKEVIIPDSVTKIGDSLFYQCSNLMTVVIPNSIESIPHNMFSQCTNLKELKLPNTITSIGSETFLNCKSLYEITLPDSVTTIDYNAFYGCFNLTIVNLGNNLLSIGNKAFYLCYNLQQVILPNTLTTIGNYAFDNCTSLTKVEIPDSVVKLGNLAFASCSSLQKVVIGNGLTFTGDSTFFRCDKLVDLTIGNKINKIGSYTFYNCDSLKNLNLPNSLTSIGNNAFAECSNLEIKFFGPAPIMNQSVFYGTPSNFKIYYLGNQVGYTNPWHGYSTEPFYMVTYDGNGSSQGTAPIDSGTYMQGTSVKVLENTEEFDINGFPFISWNTQADGNGKNFFSGSSFIMGTENVTLYANWTIHDYNVAFDSQGGSIVSEATIALGSKLTAPEPPKRDGYTFSGWFKDNEYTNAWNFNVDIITENITLYAKWTVNNYTIQFDSQGGSEVLGKSADNNSFITTPTPPIRVGYTFGGWYKESTCTNEWNFTTDKIASDITLYAKWMCIVSFDTQGGTFVPGNTLDINATIITAPNSPTKVGYIFQGWYKDAPCTNQWSFTTDRVTSNTTLYAKWSINIYTISFDSQGGTVIPQKTAEYDTTITTPTDPTKTGYTFAGWYKDSTCLNLWGFTWNKVTSNTTLYAKWYINSYTVRFYDGTYKQEITTKYNTTITAPAAPTKAGCTFRGWYRVDPSTSEWDFTKDKVDSDINLYANWYVNTVPVPTSLKSTSYSYNSIRISWSGVIGASGYDLYRCTSSGGTFYRITLTSSTSYTNTSLTAGKTYYYKVRAYRIIDSSKVYGEFGNTVSAKPIPVAPSSLIATSTSRTTIKLTWGTVAGASGYEVYRATSKTGTYTRLTRTASRYYYNTRLTPGRTYYYKVRAYKTVGTTKVYGKFSSILSKKK